MQIECEVDFNVWNCTDQEWHEFVIEQSMFYGLFDKPENEELPRHIGGHDITDRLIATVKVGENDRVIKLTRWQRCYGTCSLPGCPDPS